jgi:hypothetical protein
MTGKKINQKLRVRDLITHTKNILKLCTSLFDEDELNRIIGIEKSSFDVVLLALILFKIIEPIDISFETFLSTDTGSLIIQATTKEELPSVVKELLGSPLYDTTKRVRDIGQKIKTEKEELVLDLNNWKLGQFIQDVQEINDDEKTEKRFIKEDTRNTFRDPITYTFYILQHELDTLSEIELQNVESEMSNIKETGTTPIPAKTISLITSSIVNALLKSKEDEVATIFCKLLHETSIGNFLESFNPLSYEGKDLLLPNGNDFVFSVPKFISNLIITSNDDCDNDEKVFEFLSSFISFDGIVSKKKIMLNKKDWLPNIEILFRTLGLSINSPFYDTIKKLSVLLSINELSLLMEKKYITLPDGKKQLGMFLTVQLGDIVGLTLQFLERKLQSKEKINSFYKWTLYDIEISTTPDKINALWGLFDPLVSRARLERLKDVLNKINPRPASTSGQTPTSYSLNQIASIDNVLRDLFDIFQLSEETRRLLDYFLTDAFHESETSITLSSKKEVENDANPDDFMQIVHDKDCQSKSQQDWKQAMKMKMNEFKISPSDDTANDGTTDYEITFTIFGVSLINKSKVTKNQKDWKLKSEFENSSLCIDFLVYLLFSKKDVVANYVFDYIKKWFHMKLKLDYTHNKNQIDIQLKSEKEVKFARSYSYNSDKTISANEQKKFITTKLYRRPTTKDIAESKDLDLSDPKLAVLQKLIQGGATARYRSQCENQLNLL